MNKGTELSIVRSPLFSQGQMFKRTETKTEASSLSISSSSSEGGVSSLRPMSSLSLSTHHTQKNKGNSKTQCLKRLKKFVTQTTVRPISDITIFRFAHFYKFDYYDALDALKNYDSNKRLRLRMEGDLLLQFQTKTLFPLPGMKTKDYKCDVFYMRPSRYVPCEMKTSDLIDNLCFVLNDLSRTKEQCQNGVAFVANMNDWTMKNFSYDYCLQFMQCLQGKMVPTKVLLFLIVNPPSWFGRIWKIVRPMLSRSFAKRIRIIKEERLGEFLMNGFEKYLPDEFSCGLKDTAEVYEDYEDLKYYQDDR